MFITTGKIGSETYTIKCDSIENKPKEIKDSDKIFILDDRFFLGDKIAIDKMLQENAIDHGFLGFGPSGNGFKDNYLSNEISSTRLICGYVFDSVISGEDDWEWKNAPPGVVF